MSNDTPPSVIAALLRQPGNYPESAFIPNGQAPLDPKARGGKGRGKTLAATSKRDAYDGHAQSRKSHGKHAPKKVKKKQPQSVMHAIRKCQLSTERLLPYTPFARFVKEVLSEVLVEKGIQGVYRLPKSSILALQEESEMYVTEMFERSTRLATHAKRITVMKSDMRLAGLSVTPKYEYDKHRQSYSSYIPFPNASYAATDMSTN